MICKNCGNTLPDGATFCYYCGAAIESSACPKRVQPSVTGAAERPAPETVGPSTVRQRDPQLSVNPKNNYGSNQSAGIDVQGVPQSNGNQMSSNIVAVVALLISLVSLFLPALSVSAFGFSESVSIFETDSSYGIGFGLVIIVAMIAVIVRSKPAAIAISAVNLICAIGIFFQVIQAVNLTFGLGSIGIGMILYLVSSIVALVSSCVWKKGNSPEYEKAETQYKEAKMYCHQLGKAPMEEIMKFIYSGYCPVASRNRLLGCYAVMIQKDNGRDDRQVYEATRDFMEIMKRYENVFPENTGSNIRRYIRYQSQMADAKLRMIALKK